MIIVLSRWSLPIPTRHFLASQKRPSEVVAILGEQDVKSVSKASAVLIGDEREV